MGYGRRYWQRSISDNKANPYLSHVICTATVFRGSQFPSMQILTIAELLNGRRLEYPRGMGHATFKKAARMKRLKETDQKLPLES
jgi:hypothetical protein